MKRILTALALVAFAFTTILPATTAQADPVKPYDHKSEVWWDSLEKQLTANLSSEYEQIQVVALRHVIFFSSNYSEKIDFNNSVSPLLALYDTADDERMRVLSLAAIDAVGSRTAMDYLATHLEDEKSERMKRMLTAVLNNYYSGNS